MKQDNKPTPEFNLEDTLDKLSTEHRRELTQYIVSKALAHYDETARDVTDPGQLVAEIEDGSMLGSVKDSFNKTLDLTIKAWLDEKGYLAPKPPAEPITTDRDKLALRVLKLTHAKLNEVVNLTESVGHNTYLLKAFTADGTKMFVDERHYYPSMAGSIVVLFRVVDDRGLWGGLYDEIDVRIEREGVYLVQSNVSYKHQLPTDWIEVFNRLLDQLEQIAGYGQ